jgi:C4-dicarboxylate transporter
VLSAVIMIAFFLVIAVLMFLRKLPTLVALPILGIGLCLIAGVPLNGKGPKGEEIGLLNNVIEGGSIRLAGAYCSVIIGAWLGQIMNQTGIAKRIIKLAAELGGDRPFWIALAVLAALAVLFTTMSGLGAVIMLGTIVVPILISVGLSPLISGAIFLFGMAIGLEINVTNWAFYQKTTGVPLETIRTFAFALMAATAVAAVVFLIVEMRREGLRAFWAARTAEQPEIADEKKVNLLALLTPIIPLLLVLLFKWPIISSLLVGVLYGLITTQRSWNGFMNTLTKTAFDGFVDAGPAVMLMIGIGIVLNAVFHPNVAASIGPLLKAVVPTSPLGYVLFFSILAPLALYRGPLNLFGLGSGVAGLLIALKVLPAPAVMSAMLASERMQVIGDPTNTHNVWMAGYANVDVNQLSLKLVPYLWALVIFGMVMAGAMYL